MPRGRRASRREQRCRPADEMHNDSTEMCISESMKIKEIKNQYRYIKSSPNSPPRVNPLRNFWTVSRQSKVCPFCAERRASRQPNPIAVIFTC